MNSPDTLRIDESQVQRLFEDAGLLDAPVPDQRRVERVLERATHEKVVKDLTSFVFEGFPAVLDGLLSVASGRIHHPDNDYKA